MLNRKLISILISSCDHCRKLKLVFNRPFFRLTNLDFRAFLGNDPGKQISAGNRPKDNLRVVFDTQVPVNFGAWLRILAAYSFEHFEL